MFLIIFLVLFVVNSFALTKSASMGWRNVGKSLKILTSLTNEYL